MSLVDKLVNTTNDVTSNVSNYIKDKVIPGAKDVLDFLSGSEYLNPADKMLFTIGRPYAFNENVDPFKRLSNYIRSKMSVIDLIPCYYEIALRKMEQRVDQMKEGENPLKGGVFTVYYDAKMKEYQDLCIHHGLGTASDMWSAGSSPYIGVRLYTTDETTSTDSFNIQYQESFLQKGANAISDLGKQLHEVTRAFSGNTNASVERGTKAATGKLVEKDVMSKGVEQILLSAGDILLKGNRLSFPKIWQNTTHTGNLSAVVKLVSPYGSPTAVKQFIIKPLMYLILLASPQTRDGLSYGNTFPLTIKAYGMNHTILGAINSITLRRGGNDTSFNIYRQPLTIDVSIDFQTIYEGFAVYTLRQDKPSMQPDWDSFNKSNLVDPNTTDYQVGTNTSPLTTMGTFLKSLQPMNLVEGDFQVYGNFLRPNRPDIPDSNVNVSLANGTSAPSSVNTSSLDPFGSVLESAKKTVGSIGLNTNSWKDIVKTPPIAETFRDKVKQNFKGWGSL